MPFLEVVIINCEISSKAIYRLRLPATSKAKSLNELSIKRAVTSHYDQLAATESCCRVANGGYLESFVERDEVIDVLVRAVKPSTGGN